MSIQGYIFATMHLTSIYLYNSPPISKLDQWTSTVICSIEFHLLYISKSERERVLIKFEYRIRLDHVTFIANYTDRNRSPWFRLHLGHNKVSLVPITAMLTRHDSREYTTTMPVARVPIMWPLIFTEKTGRQDGWSEENGFLH